ncbi:uncharacterized protein LAESUDRAFT_688001, partial [Laetiporus sulphureus 93-53]
MTLAGLNALILGATGATGKRLLQELLASPQYASVSEYGRHITSPEKIVTGKEKLDQKIIDFEKLEEAGFRDKKWDVVFITMGTTRKKAGSAAAFDKIDREYVVNAARAAKSDDPSHPQRLLYVSVGGASPSSWDFYWRSKGITEQKIAELGYNDTIIFRPGILGEADRGETRVMESIATSVLWLASKVSSSVYMPVPTLAKAMRVVGAVGSSGLPPDTVQKAGSPKTPFSVLDNSSILNIADA